MDKDEFEKELLHMCTFCDSSFKDLPALKTHIKRHQNVLPLALYVTREESFVRSYNNKKKTKPKKAEDLDADPSELTQVRIIWVFLLSFPQNERKSVFTFEGIHNYRKLFFFEYLHIVFA